MKNNKANNDPLVIEHEADNASFVVNRITPRIYHVEFEKSIYLSATFLRFQEFYESPRFEGNVFTLDEYKEWYTNDPKSGGKPGKFSYYKDWSGYNFPSSALDPFRAGLFDPLTIREQRILAAIPGQLERGYIIGSGRGKASTLRHEIRHGLFYSENSYKELVQAILGTLPLFARESFESWLRKNGYADKTIEDEVHAYLCESKKYLMKEGLPTTSIKGQRRAIRALYKEYMPRASKQEDESMTEETR